MSRWNRAAKVRGSWIVEVPTALFGIAATVREMDYAEENIEDALEPLLDQIATNLIAENEEEAKSRLVHERQWSPVHWTRPGGPTQLAQTYLAHLVTSSPYCLTFMKQSATLLQRFLGGLARGTRLRNVANERM
jgi:hypothetical protein